MSIFFKVKKLNLPFGEYAVFGSGVLEAHNIRKAKDIDFIITKNLFQKLKNSGWTESKYNDKIIEFNGFQALHDWSYKEYKPNTNELIKNADIINGIPFVQLQEVYKFKKAMGRPKDLVDLKLIEKYLKYRK